MTTVRHMEETPMQYPEPRGIGYSAASYEYPEAQQYISGRDSNHNSINLGSDGHKPSAGSTTSGITAQENDSLNHVQNEYAIPSATGAPNNNNNNSRSSPPLLPLKRKSLDMNVDDPSTKAESTRKRSKVSRACDQCRRKKIRCDADTDHTGQLKTCSNCQKGGQTCEYSRIPQKRGPSKGYIKELSERVQQVEGELARAAYRGSLDSQNGELPISAEDETALRRGSSFSQQRSPFADFARERFPSVSSWHNNSITSNPRQFSIAVPPDQADPTRDKQSSATIIKPFWTDWSARPSTNNKDILHQQDFAGHDKMALQHYYNFVHSMTPILPDIDTHAMEILTRADIPFLEQFLIALKLLPHGSEPADVNIDVQTRHSLKAFINSKARLNFKQRNSCENSLVLLWTQLILFVVVQHDITSWDDQELPQCDLLQMTIVNCDTYFQLQVLEEDTSYLAEYIRGAQLTTMLARLYAILSGQAQDPMPASFKQYIPTTTVLPRHSAFLVTATDYLQTCLTLLPSDGTVPLRATSHELHRVSAFCMNAYVSAVGLSRSDPLVREVEAFAELLSLRCQGFRLHMPAVAGPVANLVEAIRLSTAAVVETSNKYIFNPLSLHTMTLATITLLELQQCRFDDAISSSLVEDSTKEMKQILRFVATQRAELTGGVDGIFWADKLHEMITDREYSRNVNTKAKGEQDMVVEMSLLLRRGYGNVLVDYVTK